MSATSNSFLSRYVQNLSSHNENVSWKNNIKNQSTPNSYPLKPLSPSRMNTVEQASSTTSRVGKSSFRLEKLAKDNNSVNTPSKPAPLTTPTPSSKKKIMDSTFKIDLSQFTKDELRYYEFLCRIAEIKQWIEQLINEELPPELELAIGDSLRNGVYLAQVVQRINPELIHHVFPAGDKLQFRHTQNINAFFSLVEHVGVPNSFKFELQDLYNKKDLPQVFETLYILISIINKKWPGKTPDLINLSSKISFSKEEVKKCRKTWPRIRDFKSLGLRHISLTEKDNDTIPSGLIQDFNDYEHSQNIPKNVPIPEKLTTTVKKDLPNNKVERVSSVSKSTEFYQEPRTPTKTPRPYYSAETPPSPDPSTLVTDIETKSAHRLNDYSSPYSYHSTALPTFPSIDPELFTRVPHLEYSPLKTSSLSYYSSSISNNLSYDTDFYRQRSVDRNNDLKFYETFQYSPSQRYSPTRRQRMNEDEFLDNVTQLQSKCRGINIRFTLHIQNHLLRLFVKETINLQGNIRGSNLRRRYRRDLNSCKSESKKNIVLPLSFNVLQSRIKGDTLRYHLDSLRIKLVRQEHVIEMLQRRSRGALLRKRTQRQLSNIQLITEPLIKFQNRIRGLQLRIQLSSPSRLLTASNLSSAVLEFQCLVRANKVREGFREVIQESKKDELMIEDFQSICRGNFRRNKQAKIIEPLRKIHQGTILKLSSHIKGYQKRKLLNLVSFSDDREIKAVTLVQSQVRGILVRYTLDLVDDIIEYNFLNQIQAHIRGFQLRSKLNRRAQYYQSNANSIIMIQSHIRMQLQRSAYLEFMEYANPCLKSVRKFTYLLNNRENIEDTQNKLESLQASFDAENIKRENLQKSIRNDLDILSVLDSYNLLKESQMKGQFDYESLNIPQSKYPSIEKLFYLLQVDPAYWKTLYTLEPEFVEKNIYMSFNTPNKKMTSTERVYFTRFLKEILLDSIAQTPSFSQSLEDKTQLWQKALVHFVQRENTEKFSLFIPLLQYLNNPKIDFEADPSLIYKQVYGSLPPNSSTPPIDDPKVAEKFIENLRNLWHAVEMIAEIFTRRTNDIPIEVRYLCTKAFCAFADQNMNEMDSLRAISNIIIKFFVAEFLVHREEYGFECYSNREMNAKLDILLHSLIKVFEMDVFDGFYDPLNQYVQDIKPHIRDILYNILIEPDYEQECDKLIYSNMTKPRPHLELLSTKIIEITQMFKSYANKFSDGGLLMEILSQNDEKLLPRSGRVNLELNPSAYKFLAVDDKMRRWYDRVKRAFIYMTQVEGIDSNLFDLLNHESNIQTEFNFQHFLRTNPKICTDPIIVELTPKTYSILKENVMQKVQELFTSGIINPSDNNLQNILNDIANTIKNPDYAMNYVKEELKVTEETYQEIFNVNQKYEIDSLQLKQKIDKTIKGFSKCRKFDIVPSTTLENLKSAYKKMQHKGSVNMQGLKFKWSTRQLYQKGVIKEIVGEKLGASSVKVFGSSGPKFPDIVFKIATSEGSRFGIQLIDKRKGPEKRYVSEIVESFFLKDLLVTQVGTKIETWELLNKRVKFSTTQLLQLVVDTFLKD
ncbi:Iqg1p NDAI_0F01300 [Naumovozyma dairenensis CBS 421]|uniref:Calponin-homology (CH) domain-containing protein n=1 Tax=Naumovozyma dairenensis (strain ATCC 10597 / BCRC 20456 / CBS 421 / NBRC 0211 / NRRL Y-12639) TaxID=1071378 RepID=G0WCD8_NAUDC|nr:hypothetical protein NDAI_0F01300 [Naumovozyma dairenensis CBS 421]CCD25449.1 hypothetical protein NDAI_0F01300 [Naumovozyma dairenensis CBS 421]